MSCTLLKNLLISRKYHPMLDTDLHPCYRLVTRSQKSRVDSMILMHSRHAKIFPVDLDLRIQKQSPPRAFAINVILTNYIFSCWKKPFVRRVAYISPSFLRNLQYPSIEGNFDAFRSKEIVYPSFESK